MACQRDHLETRTVGTQLSLQTMLPHFKSEEDGDAFGDRSTQRGATSESLRMDTPGSSHMSNHSEELRILSVYGKGEGPLAEDGHDGLFTASEVEALNSLSADHSVATGLDSERLVRREELSVQQTPDTISIKVEEDIDGGMPAVDCHAFGDRSTQCGATLESLRVDHPGSSHMSSHSEELRILSVYGKGEGPLAVDGHDTLFTASEVEALSSLSADHSVQQTPDTFSIKVEEDIGGGMPAVEDGDAFGDAPSESLRVDHPGSSHMSSHSEELRILSVYGKGEGPLAVDGHDTLFTPSEVEALSSPSADRSVAAALERGDRLVRRLESVQQTPDTSSIKVEEDIGGGMPAVEDHNDISDCSTQRGATSESLHELRILSVYGQGEGPLAVDCHDTLFAVSEPEAPSSLSADHSAAKSLNQEPLVHREEPTGHRGGLTIHMASHSGEKPYKCEQCTRSFRQRFKLKAHMRTHTGEKPYKCDQCTRSFSQRINLKNHMRTHTGEKPYKCDQCTKSFRRNNHLKRHMRTHTGEKPYRCDQCTKSFGYKISLKSHMTTHSGEKPYKCDQCTKSYGNKITLKIHMRTHTGEMPYKCDQCLKSFGRNTNLKRHMRTHTGEKLYKCDQCMKSFRHKITLKIHMTTHTGETPYRCDQCSKSFGHKITLKMHMTTHSGEKPYRCDQCTKCFGQPRDLKNHMTTHSGEKPYRCDQCTKCFGQPRDLKKHMTTHSGEKPYRCDQCTKSFGQQRDLKNHMMTHSGEKPYRCDQCMKGFGQQRELTVHMMIHSGEKPYKCDQCAKCFSVSSRLKIHMTTHTGEKLHRCDQCTKSFRKKETLKNHMRTHPGEMPFKCDQCAKGFGDRSSLKIHMRSHASDGEKPYKCDQCTKRFCVRSRLKVHMTTHTGEKPYKCDQCTKSFCVSSRLKVHMRTHTGEKPYK